MENLLYILFLSLFGSVVALAGGVIFLYYKKWSESLEINSMPFAAGVLITVSILGLMPEAVDAIGETAFSIVLITFFAAYLFEQVFFDLHHHDDIRYEGIQKSSVPLVVVGDTIHNFIDGVAIGASFLAAPGLGVVMAISTFLHEVPHEIGDFGILLKAGWKKKNIILVNIASALLTLVGAFLIYFFSTGEQLIGLLLAVSAGIFLYLGASDFLPKIHGHKGNRAKAIIPLMIGILAMAITLMVIPHSHESEGNQSLTEQAEENVSLSN